MRLEIESRPKVCFDCIEESESIRLRDWIESHPELQELLLLAIELAQRE